MVKTLGTIPSIMYHNIMNVLFTVLISLLHAVDINYLDNTFLAINTVYLHYKGFTIIIIITYSATVLVLMILHLPTYMELINYFNPLNKYIHTCM